MITVKLSKSGNIFNCEIKGHSKPSNEPCARVASTFDLLFILIGKNRINWHKENGYSFLSCYVNNNTREVIEIFKNYFYKLSKLYNQITIEEVTNNG